MAIRANHPEAIRRALGLVNPETCHWKEGLQRAAERHLFFCFSSDSWMGFGLGRDVPVPFDDIDGFYARMRDIGLALERGAVFLHGPRPSIPCLDAFGGRQGSPSLRLGRSDSVAGGALFGRRSLLGDGV